MVKQIIAISFIYLCTAIAWGILGGTVLNRTYNSNESNESSVSQLWGTTQNQVAPTFFYEVVTPQKREVERNGKLVTEVVPVTEKVYLPIDSSNVNVKLSTDPRRKGLLWYATYKVNFAGDYTFTNTSDRTQIVKCDFQLPAQQAIYDNFKYTLGQKVVENIAATTNTLTESITLKPGEKSKLNIGYDSQGLDDWRYSFGNSISQVKNFSLHMLTSFANIDFPSGSMSPTEKQKTEQGWELTWKYNNLLTGYTVGMTMPKKINPGPWVSKVTFFAPVSLFLFYFLLFMFTTIRKIKVHPMNYFFIGAGFFSFHLLLAYLVDHIPIEFAFMICSMVSIFLVVTYMRLVVSSNFAYVEVALAQFVYLVLFSWTFFYEQFTGLVVTVLCIVTLYVMMQFTGRIDWYEVFGRGNAKPSGDKLAPAVLPEP